MFIHQYILSGSAKSLFRVGLSNFNLPEVTIVCVIDPLPSDCFRVDVQERETPHLVLGQAVRVRFVNAQFTEPLHLDLREFPLTLLDGNKSVSEEKC